MSCSCNSNPCQCGQSPCQPANVIYRALCTDPGSVAALAHLSGLDSQFCEKRLLPGTGGYLVAQQNSSGTWQIAFSSAPTVAVGDITAVINQTFGKFVVNGSDNIQRQLTGPATAGLILTTNAAGDLIFTTFPVQTVPDPLVVNTITAANFTFGAGTFTGVPVFSGLSTGALVSSLGLNASNQLVKGDPSTTGVQGCMFFESPTSPSAATPNSGVVAGGLLTIGNLLADSVLPAVPGGALFSATNSQTLQCVTAGWYEIIYVGGIVMPANNSGSPSMQLLVNGVIVSNGSSRAGLAGPIRGEVSVCGIFQRRFAAGDTVQLQLASGSGANLATYEVRLTAKRTGS